MTCDFAELEFITIFSPDGCINDKGGEFAGQHRFTCRYNIQIRLKELVSPYCFRLFSHRQGGRILDRRGWRFLNSREFHLWLLCAIWISLQGLLRDKVPNSKPMQLPRCSRSGDIIEYMLVPQW